MSLGFHVPMYLFVLVVEDNLNFQIAHGTGFETAKAAQKLVRFPNPLACFWKLGNLTTQKLECSLYSLQKFYWELISPILFTSVSALYTPLRKFNWKLLSLITIALCKIPKPQKLFTSWIHSSALCTPLADLRFQKNHLQAKDASTGVRQGC